MSEPSLASAHTSVWHAVPDAVGVARQWRPADLRGLPATLRYGASLSGVAIAAARGRPRTVLLVDDDGPVTGSELESAIDAVAGELAATLRQRQARGVVVCCRGHRGLVAAVTAAGALGVDVTLVSPGAGDETIRSYTAAADVVVVDTSTAAILAELAPHAAQLDAGTVAGRLPGRSLRSVPRPRRPGGVALLTSGTTGPPRLAPRAPAGLGQLATVLSLMHALDLHRDEPVVVAPPLPHGHGLSLLTAAMVVGARAVLAHGRDGEGLLRMVGDHGAGVLAVLPAQLAGVLDAVETAGRERPRSLRRVATGSAPLPADLVGRTRDLLGDVLVDFYGSSEVGTATVATPADLREAPGTVGRPVAGVTVDVVDAAGDPVPAGVTGRVRVSSPWRALSTAHGRVDVGDLGHLDSHGRLFLDGRLDDVVVVGGHNVSLARVHAWFERQPGVTRAEIAVVPHDQLGHELVVTVVGDVDPAELRARALGDLGSADAPRRVDRA